MHSGAPKSGESGANQAVRQRMLAKYTTVILRCSPPVAASLEGWAANQADSSARGCPSRLASLAPQDDDGAVAAVSPLKPPSRFRNHVTEILLQLLDPPPD